MAAWAAERCAMHGRLLWDRRELDALLGRLEMTRQTL
jgi:hypothetical protein